MGKGNRIRSGGGKRRQRVTHFYYCCKCNSKTDVTIYKSKGLDFATCQKALRDTASFSKGITFDKALRPTCRFCNLRPSKIDWGSIYFLNRGGLECSRISRLISVPGRFTQTYKTKMNGWVGVDIPLIIGDE